MEAAKTRFTQTPDAQTFRALVASLAFERAADAALLQFVNNLALSANIEQAAANEFRTQGAKLFLQLLCDIGRPDQVVERESIGTLKSRK